MDVENKVMVAKGEWWGGAEILISKQIKPKKIALTIKKITEKKINQKKYFIIFKGTWEAVGWHGDDHK